MDRFEIRKIHWQLDWGTRGAKLGRLLHRGEKWGEDCRFPAEAGEEAEDASPPDEIQPGILVQHRDAELGGRPAKAAVLRDAEERLDAVERALPDCEALLHGASRLSRIVARGKRS